MLHSKTPNNTKARSLNWVDYISPSSESKDVYSQLIEYFFNSISYVEITALRDAVAQSEMALSTAEKNLEKKGDELTQSQCEKDLSILAPLIKLFYDAGNSLQESPQQDVQANEKCNQMQDQVAKAEQDYHSKFKILADFRSKLDHFIKKSITYPKVQ